MSLFMTVCFVASFVYALVFGNLSDVSSGVLEYSSSAVTLCFNITGAICLWSGLMQVASSSGITDKCAKLLSPLLSKIFSGLDKNGRAMQMICLNVVSNLFGLGNASTPLGIEALSEIKKEENVTDVASRNMITLAVLNTASIQLVPTTVAAIRFSAGSNSPFEIIPAVLLSSAVCVTFAVLSVHFFDFIKRRKHG